MYLSERDIQQILTIIDKSFNDVVIYMEILNPHFVKKKVERSISQSAVFTWGAHSGEELSLLCPSLIWVGDRSLVEGMEVIYPIYKLIGKIGFVRHISNQITVLKKGNINE